MRAINPLCLAKFRSSYYSPSSPLQYLNRTDPEASLCGQLLCNGQLAPGVFAFRLCELRAEALRCEMCSQTEDIEVQRGGNHVVQL